MIQVLLLDRLAGVRAESVWYQCRYTYQLFFGRVLLHEKYETLAVRIVKPGHSFRPVNASGRQDVLVSADAKSDAFGSEVLRMNLSMVRTEARK